MNYEPVTDPVKKQQFIEWLKNMAKDLNGAKEIANDKNIYPNFEHGDVAASKDLVGNFLATLSGEPVTID
jgi:hypothetical protein